MIVREGEVVAGVVIDVEVGVEIGLEEVPVGIGMVEGIVIEKVVVEAEIDVVGPEVEVEIDVVVVEVGDEIVGVEVVIGETVVEIESRGTLKPNLDAVVVEIDPRRKIAAIKKGVVGNRVVGRKIKINLAEVRVRKEILQSRQQQ